MERQKHPFEALDDIGRWGTEHHIATPEERAFFAQKAEESRQRYRQMRDENKAALFSRAV